MSIGQVGGAMGVFEEDRHWDPIDYARAVGPVRVRRRRGPSAQLVRFRRWLSRGLLRR